MAKQGTPKVHSSIKTMKKPVNAVRLNFFRTLKTKQILTTTRGILKQETVSESQ